MNRFSSIAEKSRIKGLLLNLGLALLILVFIVFLLSSFLKIYTHFGESLTVPDFKGMSLEQVTATCNEKELRFKVIDSMFIEGVPFFTVWEQSPKPLSKVKRNRTVYLTISTDKPPRVRLPNVIDISLRQATALLQSYGLKVGDTRYVPGIAQNVVIKMEMNGREVRPGLLTNKGSEIDLVMEDGLEAEKVAVQDLSGLTIEEAMFALSGYGLNIGARIFDKQVRDTVRAVIWRQSPGASEEPVISRGESVDIWLTTPQNYKNVKPQNDVPNDPIE